MAILAVTLSHGPKWVRLRRWLGMICVLGGLAGARAAEPVPTAEYQVKAAFLFNFAQFVDWPAAAYPDEKAPLVIGVMGPDPFGAYLDGLVQGEKIDGHPIVVRRFNDGEKPECHMLFVSAATPARMDRIRAQLIGQSVLTVGDTDNFSRLGGLVRFVTDKGKIHLRINAAAAKASGLTISSKLLRWATIVTVDKD